MVYKPGGGGEERTRRHYPNACRKVFRNCDGWLTCSSHNYEYVRDKCCYGKGRCLCRVNKWTGKKQEDGVANAS